MILKQSVLQSREVVLIDQFVFSTSGQLENTQGKQKKDKKLNGGTLVVDHATGFC
jgi:hypothetical protein